MMAITREKFIEATGREPQDDDLDRVNCDKAGQIGHYCCGWDEQADKPHFDTMRRLWSAGLATCTLELSHSHPVVDCIVAYKHAAWGPNGPMSQEEYDEMVAAIKTPTK